MKLSECVMKIIKLHLKIVEQKNAVQNFPVTEQAMREAEVLQLKDERDEACKYLDDNWGV